VRMEAAVFERARWAAGSWRADTARLRPLPAGFSGSPVFRVELPTGAAGVLKGFATGTSLRRAAWVHGLVGHLRSAGITEVPAVLPLPDGTTVAADPTGSLWELTDFVPGGSLSEPTIPQLTAALRLLHRVHVAAATLPGHAPVRGPSRGLATRVERARQLLSSPWAGLQTEVSPGSGQLGNLLRPRLRAAVECFAAAKGGRAVARLAEFDPPPLTCQVVLRDVSSDHVLFATAAADEVAGLIDLHAAGWDTAATDLGRLLGSWLPAGGAVASAWWAAALAPREPERPLEEQAAAVVPLVACSSILFGLDNWFRWVLVEGRSFADQARVVARVDWLIARLAGALEVIQNATPDARGLVVFPAGIDRGTAG